MFYYAIIEHPSFNTKVGWTMTGLTTYATSGACWEEWTSTYIDANGPLTKPSDYYANLSPYTRSCTPPSPGTIKVTNLNVTGETPRNVFSVINDTEAISLLTLISSEMDDVSTKMSNVMKLVDDIWAKKRGASFMKELLSNVMVQGRICDGYWTTGSDSINYKARYGGSITTRIKEWASICSAWKKEITAIEGNLRQMPLWSGWTRNAQTHLLLDVFKLATLVNSAAPIPKALQSLTDANGVMDHTGSGTKTAMQTYNEGQNSIILNIMIHFHLKRSAHYCFLFFDID